MGVKVLPSNISYSSSERFSQWEEVSVFYNYKYSTDAPTSLLSFLTNSLKRALVVQVGIHLGSSCSRRNN